MSDNPLRVLHVFGELQRGGAELRTIELAESFAARQVRSDFLVLTGREGPLDDRVRAAGGEVIKCRLRPAFPASFLRILRSRGYDVVHSHVHYFSGVILTLAGLAGVPGRVAHFRSAIANDRRDTLVRRLQLAVCRRLVHVSATDILAVGVGTMERAWSCAWRSDRRCRVIHTGIPVRILPERAAESARPPRLVNVASIQPLKNQLRLVGIFQRCLLDVPDLELVLAGREVGDYGARIRRAAEDAGIAGRLRLVGEVDDPVPLIAGSSLMVLPSQWEGLPGAVLEACAVGVPVLASDLPGTRELAAHFPHLTLLSLDAGDDIWAAAAVCLVRAARPSNREATAAFARSAFTMARTRAAHYEVWSRARAS